jgi:hypothetical protein
VAKYGPTGGRLWFWGQTVRTIAVRNPVGRAVMVTGLKCLVEWMMRQIGGQVTSAPGPQFIGSALALGNAPAAVVRKSPFSERFSTFGFQRRRQRLPRSITAV